MLLRLGPERPLYRAVYAALREAILSGRLQAGSRVPGTRALAKQLGVSRIVVLTAFERLVEEGYISSARGSGSRVAVRRPVAAPTSAAATPLRGEISAYARRVVALRAPESAAQIRLAHLPAIDFRYASFIPDAAALRSWQRAIATAARGSQFDYPDPAGLARLRQTLCGYLRRHRGVVAEPGDILILNGSQQALDLTARVLSERGAVIGIEDPHYQGSRLAFLGAGARLIPCAVDADGLDIERCAKRLVNARALYVTPSHQYPTGAIMSIERRLGLLAWAAAHRAWLIEDDYDSEFGLESGAIPALQGLDRRQCVIYIGTVVRTLSPGLRLGYVVVPEMLRDAFRGLKWLADRGSSPLEQRALGAFIESGAYARAQRRMSRALAQRRERLLISLQRCLNDTGVTWTGSGAHAFLRIADVQADKTDAFLDFAVRRGVRLYNAASYYLRRPHSATLVCGFATLSPQEIEEGVERFAHAYRAF